MKKMGGTSLEAVLKNEFSGMKNVRQKDYSIDTLGRSTLTASGNAKKKITKLTGKAMTWT